MKAGRDETRRLQTLIDLEARKEKMAAQALGDSRRNQARQQARLQELRQYQQEYLSSYQVVAQAGASMNRLNGFRLFIGRLDGVIHQQMRNLEQAGEAVKHRETAWHQAHARHQGICELMKKRRAEERLQCARIEQRISDDRRPRSDGVFFQRPVE